MADRRVRVAGLSLVVVFSLLLFTGGAVATENASAVAGGELETESVSFDADNGAESATAETNIVLSQELSRLPEQPGQYLVRHTYEMPAEAATLRVRMPAASTVRASDGFVREDDQSYRWDGSSSRPTVEYAVKANQSIDQTGPIAGPGRLVYADVGEWAVVSQPATEHSWGWYAPDDVGFERETTVDGPGAVGDVMAYLGEYEEYTRSAHGQRFRLIVPASADLAETPSVLFDSLAAASDRLRVGDRDEAVFIIATPSGTLDWGVRGLQSGPADMWVRDVEELSDPNNVWLHEYVHTRQGYAAASDLQWLYEGGATYYAALLSLDQDQISFRQFRDRLAVGITSRYSDSVLAVPGTWQENAQYHVGALVAGALDRQIRQSTDRNRSFQEVFRQLNAKTTVGGGSDLHSIITATAGDEIASSAERWTATTARPTVWDRVQHQTVFAEPPEPARITFSTPTENRLGVEGPYRNRALGETERTVVPGETVRFGVDVENFGEQSGEFTARLRADDHIVDRRTGTLAPGEQRRLDFSYPVSETGAIRLTVGDAVVALRVAEPAALRIHSLTASQSTVGVGESVRISATVTNDASWPGEATVGFTRDGALFGTERVRLDASATEEIQRTATIEEPGTILFGLGNSTETVTVTADSTSATTSENSENQSQASVADESGTGNAFGLGPALGLAVVVLVFVVLFSRRSST